MTRLTLSIGGVTRGVIVADEPSVVAGDEVTVDGVEWEVSSAENCDPEPNAVVTGIRRRDPKMDGLPPETREMAERIAGKLRVSESTLIREHRATLDRVREAVGTCSCHLWCLRGEDPACLRCRVDGAIRGEKS